MYCHVLIETYYSAAAQTEIVLPAGVTWPDDVAEYDMVRDVLQIELHDGRVLRYPVNTLAPHDLDSCCPDDVRAVAWTPPATALLPGGGAPCAGRT